MAKAIWKFPLEVTDVQTVTMPFGSTLLCVQTQREVPCIWALVDADAHPSELREARRIRIIGTGHTFHDSAEFGVYVGTFQLRDGALVFHVFAEAMF
jgi:hypothetical protein